MYVCVCICICIYTYINIDYIYIYIHIYRYIIFCLTVSRSDDEAFLEIYRATCMGLRHEILISKKLACNITYNIIL